LRRGNGFAAVSSQQNSEFRQERLGLNPGHFLLLSN